MTRSEIKAHTGLRGLAAFNVMLGHIGMDYFFPGIHLLPYYFLFGNQAVDLFFMLSGFILCYSYYPAFIDPAKKFKWWDFFVARFARIYPLFLITLFIVGAMAWVALRHGAITGEYNLRQFVSQILLLSSAPWIGVDRPWNYPSWSISVEWLCYLGCFPLIMYGLRRVGVRMAVVLIVVLLVPLTLYLFHIQQPHAMGFEPLIRGACGFSVGGLIFVLFSFAPRITSIARRSTDVFFVLALLGSAVGRQFGYECWFLLLLWPVIVLGSIEPGTITYRVTTSKIALFLGNTSYSIYLLHAIFGKALNASIMRHDMSQPKRALLGIVVISTVILTAHLSYRFFEMPARKFLRDKLAT